MIKLLLNIFFIIILFSFVGCKSSKKIISDDKSTVDTVIDKTTIIRPGDTITINIPNIRYKDTVIRKTNYETKSVATVYYDKDGNQRFECLSAEIFEIRELLKESRKNNIQTKQEQKSDFNPQYFFYSIGTLGIIICILFYMIIRIQNKIPELTSNLINEFLNKK